MEVTLLSSSNLERTGDNVPIAFPTLVMDLTVLFLPRPCIESLQIRLRCSRCKSDAILCPGSP